MDSAAAGAAKLQNGAASLQNGASSLYAGASQLADGTATLSSGASALIDGVTALRDGAMQLSDGLKQLNEEGFQKLVDAMDGDVEPLLERARALAGISGDYQTYSGVLCCRVGACLCRYIIHYSPNRPRLHQRT